MSCQEDLLFVSGSLYLQLKAKGYYITFVLVMIPPGVTRLGAKDQVLGQLEEPSLERELVLVGLSFGSESRRLAARRTPSR